MTDRRLFGALLYLLQQGLGRVFHVAAVNDSGALACQFGTNAKPRRS